ncbi:MAG: TauD/TfdA family dioxygenase [Pseudomonadota bacterium]
MKVRTLDPFAHEITELSIASLDNDNLAELRRLATHDGVVVLRDQVVSDDQFVQFLEQLAPLTFTVGEQPVAAQPKLNVVTNVGRARPPRSVFHTDTSYVSCPPSFTALRAVVTPSQGGETLFSNQYRAYDALPAQLREQLATARVRHEVTGLTLNNSAETGHWHPLLRRHPETGQTALYLSTPERCVAVDGIDVSDPAQLLQDLYEHSTRAESLLVHRWQPGDVILWDNRCTMHRADHSAVLGDRVLHRGMCAGEAPLAAH